MIAKHPENSYRLLVRNEQSQNRILAAYPSVTVVSGGLDDLETITREAARADIIIRKFSSLVSIIRIRFRDMSRTWIG